MGPGIPPPVTVDIDSWGQFASYQSVPSRLKKLHHLRADGASSLRQNEINEEILLALEQTLGKKSTNTSPEESHGTTTTGDGDTVSPGSIASWKKRLLNTKGGRVPIPTAASPGSRSKSSPSTGDSKSASSPHMILPSTADIIVAQEMSPEASGLGANDALGRAEDGIRQARAVLRRMRPNVPEEEDPASVLSALAPHPGDPVDHCE